MAKKTENPKEDNSLSLVVDFSGFVELPDGVTAEQKAEEIKQQIVALNINTLEDKEDYEVGRKLLTDLVTLRTTIEKVRKDKKDPILAAGKKVDEIAKTLTALFQTHENDLSVKVKTYEKLKEDEKNKEKIRNQARQQYLLDNHFPYMVDAFVCSLNGETLATITPRIISMSSDAEWETIVNNIINPNAEKVRAHLEAKQKQEEEDRKAFEEFRRLQLEGSPLTSFTPSEVKVEANTNQEFPTQPSTTSTTIQFEIPIPEADKEVEPTEVVLDRVLSLFKAICTNYPAVMQLEAIIKSEKDKL